MKSLCVFCGSSPGQPHFQSAAKDFGRAIAEHQLDLVYGAGKRGLMGLMADAALRSGGKVIGVIPQFLIDLEVAHTGLTELVIVRSMHERKAEMASRADAFVALPGGFGTLEEFFEVLTWLQLDLHRKPCILFNVDGFFTPLISFLRSSQHAGFISSESMDLITVCTTIDELLNLVLHSSSPNGFQETLT
jgi:uncharacterized protein (TIGR00730 family)